MFCWQYGAVSVLMPCKPCQYLTYLQMNHFFKHACILGRSYGSTPDPNNAFLHQSKSSFYVDKPFDISLVLTKPLFGHVIYVLWTHAIHRNSLWSRSRVINGSGGRLTKAYDVTVKRYRNSHAKIEDSKMQRCPLKFHTKFWTHTLQNMHFTRC